MSTMLGTIVDAWTKAWGEGKTGAYSEIVADNYSRQSKSGDEGGLAEVIRQIEDHHRAFSNHHVEILHAIEDDGSIAIHWRSEATHTGEYMGVPPTGRVVSVLGASFIYHQDGKITQEWVVWDPRDMLSAINIWHLGARPTLR